MVTRAVPRLVLASTSASRLRVLRDAGFDPIVSASGVDESIGAHSTEALVVELARRKAAAVGPRFPDDLVLGCDSMLDLDGVALGKPTSPIAALENWRALSGRTAVLHTGHVLLEHRTGRSASEVVRTSVRFGEPSRDELEAYVATGEPLRAAGGFTIEGRGAPFVVGIEGDPLNVLGLSVRALRSMLAAFDLSVVDLWAPAARASGAGPQSTGGSVAASSVPNSA